MKNKYRYTVELGRKGCAKCKHGRTWDVLTPEGIALGSSYGDKDDADYMADELNAALEIGEYAASHKSLCRKIGGAK